MILSERPDVDDLVDVACPSCEGTRLNATARAVKFAGVGITDIARLSVTEIRKWEKTGDARLKAWRLAAPTAPPAPAGAVER